MDNMYNTFYLGTIPFSLDKSLMMKLDYCVIPWSTVPIHSTSTLGAIYSPVFPWH